MEDQPTTTQYMQRWRRRTNNHFVPTFSQSGRQGKEREAAITCFDRRLYPRGEAKKASQMREMRCLPFCEEGMGRAAFLKSPQMVCSGMIHLILLEKQNVF